MSSEYVIKGVIHYFCCFTGGLFHVHLYNSARKLVDNPAQLQEEFIDVLCLLNTISFLVFV